MTASEISKVLDDLALWIAQVDRRLDALEASVGAASRELRTYFGPGEPIKGETLPAAPLGQPYPVCTCGHSWSSHEHHDGVCIECTCEFYVPRKPNE
jgi:hypothetical protein